MLKLSVYIGCLFSMAIVFAMPNSPLLSKYAQVQNLCMEDQYARGESEAIAYLKQYPNDDDVRFMLAQCYFKEKQYTKARDTIEDVLSARPNDEDALLMYVNIESTLHEYQKAEAMADVGLTLNPLNSELRKKKQDIAYLKSPPTPEKQPTQKRHRLPKQKQAELSIPESTYQNKVGVMQQNYYISDRKQVWDYTTAFYGRTGELGSIYGKVNYASRLGFEATQGLLEVIPKLGQYAYLDFQAAIAKKPELFPDHLYYAELFVTIPRIIELSGGGSFNYINNIHQFSSFLGSAAKQVGNHRLTYRGTYYYPNKGPQSFLSIIDYRYYMREPNIYCGVFYGIGSSPDLADLLTVNFLVTQNHLFSPYVAFTLFHDRLTVNTNFYYQHQVFSSLPIIRNWTGGILQLSWNF